MPTIEFAIDLTAGDNTAFTVLTALRSLGYKELERVERSELLRLRLAEGAMSTEECARSLTHAEVVFNPNKHRLAFAANGESPSSEAVVADIDDDNSALKSLLTTRFGMRGLDRVDRLTSWRLFENGNPAPAERLDWACRALLANPHSQTYVVRKRPVYTIVA